MFRCYSVHFPIYYLSVTLTLSECPKCHCAHTYKHALIYEYIFHTFCVLIIFAGEHGVCHIKAAKYR